MLYLFLLFKLTKHYINANVIVNQTLFNPYIAVQGKITSHFEISIVNVNACDTTWLPT